MRSWIMGLPRIGLCLYSIFSFAVSPKILENRSGFWVWRRWKCLCCATTNELGYPGMFWGIPLLGARSLSVCSFPRRVSRDSSRSSPGSLPFFLRALEFSTHEFSGRFRDSAGVGGTDLFTISLDHLQRLFVAEDACALHDAFCPWFVLCHVFLELRSGLS